MVKKDRLLFAVVILGGFLAVFLGYYLFNMMKPSDAYKDCVDVIPLEEIKCESIEMDIDDFEIEREIQRKLALAEEEVDEVQFNDTVIINKKGYDKEITINDKWNSLLGKHKNDIVDNIVIVKITRIPSYEDYLKKIKKSDKEFRNIIRKEIIDSKGNVALAKQKKEVIEYVVENSSVKRYPKKELKAEKKSVKSQYIEEAKEDGLSLNEFAQKYLDKDVKELNKMISETAKANLKRKMVLKVVADELDVKISQKDCDKYVKDLEKKAGKKLDRKNLNQNAIQEQTKEDKIANILLEMLWTA